MILRMILECNIWLFAYDNKAGKNQWHMGVDHSVIQGQFSLQANSKIFDSSPKGFLPRHFEKWLPSTPTDHFFVDFHLNSGISNYDDRAYVN